LEDIEPIAIAVYIEQLGTEMATPSVKQHLAAIRVLFDYLVTGGILPPNPAGSVRGPEYGNARQNAGAFRRRDTPSAGVA